MKSGVGERQTRSDKKVEIKATMSIQSKRKLYDFAEMCAEPIKDVAERLIVLAAGSSDIIDDICGWFRRDYEYRDSVALGDERRPKLSVKSIGPTETVSLKFKRANYDALCAIAYALDTTPSSAASILIVMAMKNHFFMAKYIDGHLTNVPAHQVKRIKRFLNV